MLASPPPGPLPLPPPAPQSPSLPPALPLPPGTLSYPSPSAVSPPAAQSPAVQAPDVWSSPALHSCLCCLLFHCLTRRCRFLRLAKFVAFRSRSNSACVHLRELVPLGASTLLLWRWQLHVRLPASQPGILRSMPVGVFRVGIGAWGITCLDHSVHFVIAEPLWHHTRPPTPRAVDAKSCRRQVRLPGSKRPVRWYS